MNMALVLPPDAVVLDVALSSKALALAHAADLLAASSGISGEAIESALLAREALGSTGVGHSVALPHARLHVLSRAHAVFFRLAAPIPFDAIDGQPVDVVCAVVAPDEPNSALLTAVSALSRVLRNAEKMAMLRTCTDAEEARAVLLAGG
jgi:PTS system nitrogen regulatory IIA component